MQLHHPKEGYQQFSGLASAGQANVSFAQRCEMPRQAGGEGIWKLWLKRHCFGFPMPYALGGIPKHWSFPTMVFLLIHQIDSRASYCSSPAPKWATVAGDRGSGPPPSMEACAFSSSVSCCLLSSCGLCGKPACAYWE